MTSKSHWENIYENKAEAEYSWFQPYPHTSIELIEYFHLLKDARIIDTGGGRLKRRGIFCSAVSSGAGKPYLCALCPNPLSCVCGAALYCAPN